MTHRLIFNEALQQIGAGRGCGASAHDTVATSEAERALPKRASLCYDSDANWPAIGSL
jgi:hypothetical protein